MSPGGGQTRPARRSTLGGMTCPPPGDRLTCRFQLFSGAGNRFLVVEEVSGVADWAVLAREACELPLFEGEPADGLLVIGAAEAAEARMIVWNADGSRPEACGNGLRCVGWWLARAGRGEQSQVLTDAGARRVEVVRQAGNRALIRAEMGQAECFELTAALPEEARGAAATGVRIGNPHCVLRVEDEREASVETVGEALQNHPDFPEGVNVGFLARRDGAWQLRVFERGVGETGACGSGACAAASVVGAEGEELAIEMRGGRLVVHREPGGQLELVGEAVFHGEVELEVHPTRTTAGP